MNDYAFGNFIYTLRTEKGLSQTQLGEMLGVTNKAVSKWENSSAKPNTALLPKIAEIFEITVEELFACKRIEKDAEYENIKTFLLLQRKKYAILSSFFLSLILILPLLLIEFIAVIMGLSLPDDVIGPLGSMGIIFTFVISVTAYIIYHINFKRTITPTETNYDPSFVRRLSFGTVISAIAVFSLLMLIIVGYLLITYLSSNFLIANIFLSASAFAFIISLGCCICFSNIERLLLPKLKLKVKNAPSFSQWPRWAKICYIIAVILFGVLYILASYAEWELLWILTRILYVASLVYLLSGIIKSKKK